jgi:hypothetical protein
VEPGSDRTLALRIFDGFFLWSDCPRARYLSRIAFKFGPPAKHALLYNAFQGKKRLNRIFFSGSSSSKQLRDFKRAFNAAKL